MNCAGTELLQPEGLAREGRGLPGGVPPAHPRPVAPVALGRIVHREGRMKAFDLCKLLDRDKR